MKKQEPFTIKFKTLLKVQKEIDKMGIVNTREQGWQTQKFAKASRKLDYLCMKKINLLRELEDVNRAEKENFLISAGWQKPFDGDWWVHPTKTTENRKNKEIDFTKYGMTLDYAFNFEVEFNLKNYFKRIANKIKIL